MGKKSRVPTSKGGRSRVVDASGMKKRDKPKRGVDAVVERATKRRKGESASETLRLNREAQRKKQAKVSAAPQSSETMARLADGHSTEGASVGTNPDESTVFYDNGDFFRLRLVNATLSGRSCVMSNIRSRADDPGVRDFEVGFVRLLDRISNGCVVSINETGTEVRYRPGVLVGGKFTHECGTSRAIGYYLEALAVLAPFCKKPVNATLNGLTNSSLDLSVDVMRLVTLRMLHNFGVEDGLELKITQRGAPPLGGGRVVFRCGIVRSLKPVHMLLVDDDLSETASAAAAAEVASTQKGKPNKKKKSVPTTSSRRTNSIRAASIKDVSNRVQKIRGIAYSMRVSPAISNRVILKTKEVLTPFLEDVYIYVDHFKGAESGKSPGYGMALVAETTNGCIFAAERVAGRGDVAEDIGQKAAEALLVEIQGGGYCDASHQWLVVQLMAVCSEDVSRVDLGRLAPYTIGCLRTIRDFFGLTFKLDPLTSDGALIRATVRGMGVINTAKTLG